MTNDLCVREAEVLRACASGDWPDDLQTHVATCDGCRDVRAVALCLQGGLAEEHEQSLPDAAGIWWRAKVQAQREARQRALRPIDALERSEPLVALVAVVTLLVLRGDAIASRVVQWATGDATGQMLAVLPPALLPVLFVGFALCGVVLLVGLGAVLASD
jgi:hypothetical protein